ncbi:MAG: hypothetical protein ACRELE_00995 [Gemmatimonadales bacterium]
MIRRVFAPRAASAISVLLVACGVPSRSRDDAVTPREASTNGWVSLFDTRTLIGWHTYQQPNGVTPGWRVDEAAIRTDGTGRDLVSDLQYSAFEFDLE